MTSSSRFPNTIGRLGKETLDRGDSEPYFLGSPVLVEQDDASFDVIDGQQRLSTLTLLFSALRDLVEVRRVRSEPPVLGCWTPATSSTAFRHARDSPLGQNSMMVSI
ncbi:GmrSD restriction endonuclease domain-containing protein [Rhodococcus sp. T7]|uniref:GmrSD restriction endonuclease domain-containing protein n=1 Tax=Rhodococcus sp. T7 TaxID=627444 RepID=UPI001358E590|nr:DUF262 domain-containing protein [Rhodococcus sp. T7]